VLRDDTTPNRSKAGAEGVSIVCYGTAVRAAAGEGACRVWSWGGGQGGHSCCSASSTSRGPFASPANGESGTGSPPREGVVGEKGVSGHPEYPHFNSTRREPDGGNNTFCAAPVNTEASDTALPVTIRPNSLSNKPFRHASCVKVGASSAAHPGVRPKLREGAAHRNPLRMCELGKSRRVHEGAKKKKC
jgi:hypothetical protein